MATAWQSLIKQKTLPMPEQTPKNMNNHPEAWYQPHKTH